jgi:transposase-like protein
MAQHFLLSAGARSLSAAKIMRMSDGEIGTVFLRLRWPETDGKPVCPDYGCTVCYACPRPSGQLRWRCKACRRDFSITSGTLFAWHKLRLRSYLLAVAAFCNEVKGKSALALSRDLDVQYKTAWVLAHKLREAMATEVRGYKLGGIGKTVEVDGAYFGGYVKPANHKENRRDRRLTKNQNGKRQCVVVIRQRGGMMMPSAFKTEGSALAYIRKHVAAGTEVHADEASSWNDLHGHYVVKRINHQLSYSDGIACTNSAESFFSRLRRAETGHHHHIAGVYLARYAQESAWREGHRRTDNGRQVQGVVGLALRARPSVDFCGYWQRTYQA